MGDILGVVTKTSGATQNDMIAPSYDLLKSYVVGEKFTSNNILYRVKTACSGVIPPNITYYEEIKVSDINFYDRLTLANANVANYNDYNNPPITLGPQTGAHLELSPNRVLAKANETTGAELYINYASGKDVYMTDMWPTREIKAIKLFMNKIKDVVSNTTITLSTSYWAGKKYYNYSSTGTIQIDSSGIGRTGSRSSSGCDAMIYTKSTYNFDKILGVLLTFNQKGTDGSGWDANANIQICVSDLSPETFTNTSQYEGRVTGTTCLNTIGTAVLNVPVTIYVDTASITGSKYFYINCYTANVIINAVKFKQVS